MGYLLSWGWIDSLSSIPLLPASQLGRLAPNCKNPSLVTERKINNCADPGIDPKQTTDRDFHGSAADWNDTDILQHCDSHR